MTSSSTTEITDMPISEVSVTPISFMPQFALPFTVNLKHSDGDKKHERSLEANTVPVTDLGLDIRNFDDAANETSSPSLHNVTNQSEVEEINATEHNQLPSSLMLNSSYGDLTDTNNTTNTISLSNLHNISGQGGVKNTEQTGMPGSVMLNSSDDNVTTVEEIGNITKDNNAIKLIIAQSSNNTNQEFNKALKTFMTNSSYRSKTVASNQTVIGSRKPDQGQKTITDYFENNANVEEVAGDLDVTVKSTDLQDVDDKVLTEQPETSEGIQVEVKGHTVEPAEPFAFIEKDETKAPTEYQYTWGEWSECSLTCGVGQKFRTNRCGGDLPCTGIKASSETEVCSIKDEC
ncbi:unnamed protein product [Candidula unifasciata]|uniref:Uncharacterized protein n=1 Tax=Candidula unifasciata TaxID=100452 RepID=A0A8S3YZJ4_9EUPU|nr:unnamed protein product [Candidula unifasciata]